MDGQRDNRKRLACLLGEVAAQEGVHWTFVEVVEVPPVSHPVPRALVVYQTKILIVGQGCKRAYLDGEVYRYDAYNYMVLSVPLPGGARPRRARRSSCYCSPSTGGQAETPTETD